MMKEDWKKKEDWKNWKKKQCRLIQKRKKCGLNGIDWDEEGIARRSENKRSWNGSEEDKV